MIVICTILGPMIKLLNGSANWAVRRLGIEPQEELASVRSMEELELLIQSSGAEGTLEPAAMALLTRSIRFGEQDAADAFLPRTQVEAVSIDEPIAVLVAKAIASGSYRVPVVGADSDSSDGRRVGKEGGGGE